MWDHRRPTFYFKKRGVPYKKHQWPSQDRKSQSKTYIPLANVPLGEWINPIEKPKTDHQKWKSIEVGATSSYHDNSQVLNKYSYASENYLGNKPMTMTQ